MTSTEWGRVDEDGTVYVKTADGERAVGQYPDGHARGGADLLHRALRRARVRGRACSSSGSRSGVLSPEEATDVGQDRARRRSSTPTPSATSPRSSARLDALGPVHRAAARGPQGRAGAAAPRRPRPSKEKHRRRGREARRGQRLAQRRQPAARAARRVEGAAPHRPGLRRRAVAAVLDGARTTYTRRRKAHFAEQHEKRDGARVVKERLAKEAEALADLDRLGSDRRPVPRPDAPVEGRRPGAAATSTTSCGSGSAAPRTRSSAPATPPTPRWTRSSPPTPRSRRSCSSRPRRCVPVTDLEAAKRAFRDIADRWDAAGKVPRDRMKDLEGRIRKVEQAIRGVEDEQWKRSDPEKSARADDMVAKLEAAHRRRSRPTSRRPAPPATRRRSRSSRRTSPPASRSSRWPSRRSARVLRH